MTIRAVADTHATLWYLYNDARLSEAAGAFMDAADAAGDQLPDRIVAATALHLGVPVISRDRKIRASVVATIW